MIRQHIGHYDIVEELGHGGMGVVWKAWDNRLNRLVAIKAVGEALQHDSVARTRFLHEARTASTLNHPNIVTIYDVVEQDGESYIVMEYVAGRTLQHRIAERLDFKEALRLAIQIARGVARAHSVDLIHRDLKPSNILITDDGTAKLLDFGLAKATEPRESTGTATLLTLTEPGKIVGTIAYMSPEQAEGKPLGVRSDVFSLGTLLYEMFAGRRPFDRDSQLSTLMAIVKDAPQPIQRIASGVPPEVASIINRCLEKDPDRRYASAAGVERDLESAYQAITSGSISVPALLRTARRPRVGIALGCLVALLVAAGVWWARRQADVNWARTDGVGQVKRYLETGEFTTAFDMVQRIERSIPDDAVVAKLWDEVSREDKITTVPPGATMYRKAFLEPDSAWRSVGTSPATLRVPRGNLLLKFEKAGYVPTTELSPVGNPEQEYFLVPSNVAADGMVAVAKAPVLGQPIARLGSLNLTGFPPFLIDRHEVTNADFKRFVDAGGYQNPEYWIHPFRRGDKTLSREEAMSHFRDATGRPGPGTWEGGTYKAGQDRFPVGGVSWYEAAAYAKFAGKELPTVYHWYRAAEPRAAVWMLAESNFSGSAAAVGSYPRGVSAVGIMDTAGNVKEWCFNEAQNGLRYTLGGHAASPGYAFYQADAQLAFDRSPMQGFRCVRNIEPPQESIYAARSLATRDVVNARPVDDETFAALLPLYAYEKRPLKAQIEAQDDKDPDFTREDVSFDTAYGGRMNAVLYLPKRTKPPFHAVVYHPSAYAQTLKDAKSIEAPTKWDYIPRTGRAFLYAMVWGTHGRRGPINSVLDRRNSGIHRNQDIQRAVDYLESRQDIEAGKIAYFGLSWGGGNGVIDAVVDKRFRAAILHDGGFFLGAVNPSPELNQVNFAPRMKIPVLMLNGRYDFFFPMEDSQKPLFRMLGSPPGQKKHVIFEAAHDVSMLRQPVMREVLDWLDKYLGPVQR